MTSSYKDSVSWSHIVTQTPEKAKEYIEQTNAVAEHEKSQDGSAFYIVLSPLEGQHFEQPERLEVIINHDKSHLENHKNSKANRELQETAEKKELLKKPPMNMTFTPVAGYASRKSSKAPPLRDQFVWAAKLDSHEGKFDEFVEAIKKHAGNVERNEDETLTFLVLESHDTKNSVTLLERYTSEKYFKEVHSNSESMQEYRKKMESLMAERVTAGFRIVAGHVEE